MGQLTVSKAVTALNQAGIPAKRGYPTQKLGSITGPVAAVNIQSGDMREKTLTLLVTVAAPSAEACEEAALAAGECLNLQGAKCRLGQMKYESLAELFSMELTAEYATEIPKITINQKVLSHVTAFTCWRGLDDVITDWDNTKWNFRLEEYFPMGQEEESAPAGEFDLTHTSENGTESYLLCSWTYQRRVWDASGIRQIRLGVAQTMDIG